MALVLDTGPIVAALDKRDRDHEPAAVMAIVERLREPKLATLDHRHFSVMRPRHVAALELLPA